MWPRTFSTISSCLERKRNSLISCRIQQKIHQKHKICLWLERIRSWQKEFAYTVSVLQFNRIYMKLKKFGILANKTTSLFTSIRDSNISRGCAKILEIMEGSGGKFGGLILEKSRGKGDHTANPFRGGGMDIFWNHTFQSIH